MIGVNSLAQPLRLQPLYHVWFLGSLMLAAGDYLPRVKRERRVKRRVQSIDLASLSCLSEARVVRMAAEAV